MYVIDENEAGHIHDRNRVYGMRIGLGYINGDLSFSLTMVWNVQTIEPEPYEQDYP